MAKVLGDASYSIHLSHLFVIMLIEAAAKRMVIHPDLVMVVGLVGSAVVGIIVYRIAEKPMLRKGQSSVRKWRLQHVRNLA